eukprot:gene25609-30929_t
MYGYTGRRLACRYCMRKSTLYQPSSSPLLQKKHFPRLSTFTSDVSLYYHFPSLSLERRKRPAISDKPLPGLDWGEKLCQLILTTFFDKSTINEVD